MTEIWKRFCSTVYFESQRSHSRHNYMQQKGQLKDARCWHSSTSNTASHPISQIPGLFTAVQSLHTQHSFCWTSPWPWPYSYEDKAQCLFCFLLFWCTTQTGTGRGQICQMWTDRLVSQKMIEFPSRDDGNCTCFYGLTCCLINSINWSPWRAQKHSNCSGFFVLCYSTIQEGIAVSDKTASTHKLWDCKIKGLLSK